MLPAVILRCIVLVCMIGQHKAFIKYKTFPAPDGHSKEQAGFEFVCLDGPMMQMTCFLLAARMLGCGICPTYYQKICAFDFHSNKTYIFDNHCVMDLFNCIEGTNFESINYEECLFFGNFAYVHGMRYEDQDYDEDNIKVIGAKKNPDSV